MLGVSKRTVENRIAEYELTNRSRYSDIDDDMLDSFVKNIMVNLPRSGKPCKNIMQNYLQCKSNGRLLAMRNIFKYRNILFYLIQIKQCKMYSPSSTGPLNPTERVKI